MRICTYSNSNSNAFSQYGVRPCVHYWPTATVAAASAHRIWPQVCSNKLRKICSNQRGEELDLFTLASRI